MLTAELKVVGGKQHGSLIPLRSKKFLVGREQDCHLRPTSESVSRHHCVFSTDDFGVRIRDLGSTNGTFVNGQRVQGQVALQPNDRVLIGKLEFEIVIHGAVPAMQPARAGVSLTGSNSDVGFMLTDLAESPESSNPGVTLPETGPTAILESDASSLPTETTVMSTENTVLVPPSAPLPQVPVAEVIPGSDEIPLVAESQPTAMAAPQQMPQGMPGMPMPSGNMTPPYGMPQQMPGGYPQPAFLQAPYSNYAPQYMPNPYGMQPQFMPQGFADPYQMAYQQQMAQQQAMAQQQQMAQFGMPQQLVAPDEPIEEVPAASAQAVLPVRLPPPEETGVRAPVAPPASVPAADGAPPPPPVVKPNQLAADILKKMMSGKR